MPARAVLAVFAAALCPAQSVVYVDPVVGIDQAGGGSSSAPLKTLTFAATRAGGATTYRLRPGTYDQNSGETFPITFTAACVVEADPARVPPYSRAVTIDTPLALAATLFFAPAQGGTVVVRDIAFSGGMYRAVRMDAPAAVASALFVERCKIVQSRCIVLNVAAGGTAAASVLDCELQGLDAPIIVAAQNGAQAALLLDRSVVRNGLRDDVLLDASGGGSIHAHLRASRIGDASLHAVYAVTDGGGSVTTRIEHCLLHDIGTRTIGGNVGAINDLVGARGLPPTHVVVNCIFDNNRADAPNGTNGLYAWGNNLVTQANLAGFGGNVVGTASFVDALHDDYHLVLGSAGMDAGRPADRTAPADLDGDPYLDALPDLGPDEVHFAYVAAPRQAALGGALVLRPLVAPNAPFVLLVGSDRVPGSFGPGVFHLAGAIADPGLVGVCDPRGVGQTALRVPNVAALHLRSVYWQAGTTLPPVFGSNAHRVVLGLP
ncbi:MAG: DUF1565 domain-containing protein [Planctomycetota bacterium]